MFFVLFVLTRKINRSPSFLKSQKEKNEGELKHADLSEVKGRVVELEKKAEALGKNLKSCPRISEVNGSLDRIMEESEIGWSLAHWFVPVRTAPK